jgi:signal transduction histidine kinase
VRLWVDDQGPGVPPRDRERIFAPFVRLARDRVARDHGEASRPGSGLGLAVVRDLVALHGGRVWVEDAPGGGARFVVELPNGDVPDGEVPDGEVPNGDLARGRA